MKKILAGAILLGTMSAGAYAAEAEREPFKLDPRGTVEIGFEWEEFTSSNGQADNDFLLPYVKTKTHFNQTTPYYIEANHSYRHYSDSAKRDADKRRRYELFFGGYEYEAGDFAWKPKVGFRHEDFDGNGSRDKRTYWRIYPGTTYQLTDRAQLFVGGWVAPVSDDNDGSDEVYYKHELEFGVKYKLNDRNALNVNIFSDVEKAESNRNGSTKDSYDQVEWQLRARLDHKFENGKTTAYGFARIGLDRRRDYKSGASQENQSNVNEDKNRNRHRFGIGGSHKLNDDFSVLSEVYYETSNGGRSDDGSANDDNNKMFVKMAVRYAY